MSDDGGYVMVFGRECPLCGCLGVFSLDHRGRVGYQCEGCLRYFDAQRVALPEGTELVDLPDVRRKGA